ncbi:MAG: hypothetical protein K8S98_16270 [Planctomycetes bacterium]|nr:hypothetical protein [Planctomycetota bacterium]
MKRAVVGTSSIRRPAADRRSHRERFEIRLRAGVGRALLAAFCFGAASSAAFAATPVQGSQGTIVGEFELAAPASQSFTLRATIPVFPGTFPRPDGLMPFAIRDSNGALVPAQVDPVSYYPNDAVDGADVVELTAAVRVPPGTQVGAHIQYKVIDSPHPAGTFPLTPAVQSLFTTAGAVSIRTRDVFGNTYVADLLRGADDTRLLRSGEFREQTRFYEVMRPTTTNYGAPSGPLRRMMGVHSYVSTWAGEDMISLDLRIHNGTSGEDGQDPIDDPQERLYFDQLEIVVPQGWVLLPDIQDVSWGAPVNQGATTVYPIVKGQPGNTLNVLPVQAQFHRRLVLAKASAVVRAQDLVTEQWLGFCQPDADTNGPYLSWWNRFTARYFPQHHVLPRFDFKGKNSALGKMKSEFETDHTALLTGKSNGGYPYYSDQMGWAFPFGSKYGGMTGGSDIYLYDGVVTAWAASNEGYRHAQITHRMYTDRQAVALYNKDGDPTSLHDWITHGPQFDYVHMEFYLTPLPGPDPFGFTSAPTYQIDAVAAQGRQPAYESELLSYFPIDVQHHIRWLRSPKVLLWLGNDAIAKDDLRMEAEILRLSYHQYPTSPSNGVIPSGMLFDIRSVETNPAVGFACGRGEAWTIDCMCAAYSIADPAWRAEAKPWFDAVTKLMRSGQADCSGFLMRLKTNKDFNGQYFVRRSTETAMLDQALVSIVESVYRGVDVPRQKSLEYVLTKQFYGEISPMSWSATQKGPISSIAVAPLSGAPFCGTTPGQFPDADKFQSWSSLAYAYELTSDPIFLKRAAEMSGSSVTKNTLGAQQNMSWGNHENRAGLLALVQQLWLP